MDKLLQLLTYAALASLVIVLWIAIPTGRGMFACYESNTKNIDEVEISIRSVGWSEEHSCETKRGVIDRTILCLEGSSSGNTVQQFLSPYVLRVVQAVRPGSKSVEDMKSSYNAECESFPLLQFETGNSLLPSPAP